MGKQGSGFSGRTYYHAIHLFVYNLVHVVIMSIHDSVFIADSGFIARCCQTDIYKRCETREFPSFRETEGFPEKATD